MFAHFLTAYPRRTALMVLLLLLSGLAEGVGIVTLLPVLEAATGEGGGDSALRHAITAFLDALALPSTLGVLLVLVVAAIALKGLFRWLAMRQVGYMVAQVARDLRLRLIRALLRVRWTYFAGQPAGHLANAISHETFWAAHAYRDACVALAGVVQLAVYAAIILLVSWKVALLAALAGGIITLLLMRFVWMSRDAGRKQAGMMKSLSARLTDLVQGIKSVKAMAREAEYLPVLEEETEGVRDAERRQVLASESLQSFQEPLLAVVIAIGLYAVLTWGDQPFATLLLVVFVFHRFIVHLHRVQLHYQGMVAAEGAFSSLLAQIESAERDLETSEGSHRLPRPLRHGIRLERVSFAHGADEVLTEVSLEIPAGSFVSIVGPSGGGKTTLVDLITGLHRPGAGEIFVDDVPLSEVDLHAWRRMIGYVPQETILLHDTVARNVSLGDGRLERARIERALRDAGALDFVTALPDGMDTVVGERGMRLSGGERKRMALARALAADPTLLILDEATAEVDPAAEAAIAETLTGLLGSLTIVSISHQWAMEGLADAVYEIRNGKVSEARRPLKRTNPVVDTQG